MKQGHWNRQSNMAMAGALCGLNKELNQWLKDKHPKVACRVIFTTGDMMDVDTQIFIEQAYRLFLSKALTPTELKSIVREALK